MKDKVRIDIFFADKKGKVPIQISITKMNNKIIIGTYESMILPEEKNNKCIPVSFKKCFELIDNESIKSEINEFTQGCRMEYSSKKSKNCYQNYLKLA